MKIIEKNFKWSQPLKKRKSTRYIILHHRAGDGDVESIHKQHLSQQYAGIGYHFYVRKNGEIYRGRPIDKMGAQCLNYNDESIGVCFEGNFETERTMSKNQFNSGVELLKYLSQLYPNAVLVGHSNLYATACPGRFFPMSNILSEVFNNMDKELTSANDIIWELMNGKCQVPIDNVDNAVKALDRAKSDSLFSPLYWILKKIANNITKK